MIGVSVPITGTFPLSDPFKYPRNKIKRNLDFTILELEGGIHVLDNF